MLYACIEELLTQGTEMGRVVPTGKLESGTERNSDRVFAAKRDVLPQFPRAYV